MPASCRVDSHDRSGKDRENEWRRRHGRNHLGFRVAKHVNNYAAAHGVDSTSSALIIDNTLQDSVEVHLWPEADEFADF